MKERADLKDAIILTHFQNLIKASETYITLSTSPSLFPPPVFQNMQSPGLLMEDSMLILNSQIQEFNLQLEDGTGYWDPVEGARSKGDPVTLRVKKLSHLE